MKIGINNMINFVIFCSNEEVLIERTAVTFLDILSIVGGFSSLIFFFTKILSRIYSTNNFKEALI